jgi:hypothetical protein
MSVLAQHVARSHAVAPTSHSVTLTAIWLTVMLLIVVVAGVGILLFRRQVIGKQAKGAVQAGALDELRAMRDRGEVSPEEFDDLRSRIVARAAGRPTPRHQARSAAPKPWDGSVQRAKPGFDLAGDRLPPSSDDDEPRPG